MFDRKVNDALIFRSNVLHYQENNQKIETNDLIMLDAGGLVKQYASDITRFWPNNGKTICSIEFIVLNVRISGRFSSIHRQLYEILLTVQKHLIDLLKNDDRQNLSRSFLNQQADLYMIKYLREESILSRTIEDENAKNIVNRLCPTSVAHHLGLDVHDCESISFFDKLRPGNVITIEPGLIDEKEKEKRFFLQLFSLQVFIFPKISKKFRRFIEVSPRESKTMFFSLKTVVKFSHRCVQKRSKICIRFSTNEIRFDSFVFSNDKKKNVLRSF